MTTLAGAIGSGTLTEILEMGNAILGDRAKLKTLHAFMTSTGLLATPREFGQSSGYLVPPGKVFVVVGTFWARDAGGAGNIYSIGSGTTDVGFASASFPTVNDFGGTYRPNVAMQLAAYETIEIPVLMRIPAGLYLLVVSDNQVATNTDVVILGYEIDATASDI